MPSEEGSEISIAAVGRAVAGPTAVAGIGVGAAVGDSSVEVGSGAADRLPNTPAKSLWRKLKFEE